ncbi:MAG: hypothetical protein HY770_05225 [Chitinivibrionia bacterium]|nr:hypothetical protein [Chitinivibrionia bacterium]
MNAKAMEPFGKALLAYFEGGSDAELIVRRDDETETVVPVSLFFRDELSFTEIERRATKLCKGSVLDIAAAWLMCFARTYFCLNEAPSTLS